MTVANIPCSQRLISAGFRPLYAKSASASMPYKVARGRYNRMAMRLDPLDRANPAQGLSTTGLALMLVGILAGARQKCVY